MFYAATTTLSSKGRSSFPKPFLSLAKGRQSVGPWEKESRDQPPAHRSA